MNSTPFDIANLGEKRRAIRYRVGNQISATIATESGGISAGVGDISTSGTMLVLPHGEGKCFRPSTVVEFILNGSIGEIALRGKILHRSSIQRGVGLGIAFDDKPAARSIAADVFADPESGGIRLSRDSRGIVIQVHGRLSFATSRDCLALIRRRAVCRIDLTCCASIDSAGLGTLCIAREESISVTGARGLVKQMLAVARIAFESA